MQISVQYFFIKFHKNNFVIHFQAQKKLLGGIEVIKHFYSLFLDRIIVLKKPQ